MVFHLWLRWLGGVARSGEKHVFLGEKVTPRQPLIVGECDIWGVFVFDHAIMRDKYGDPGLVIENVLFCMENFRANWHPPLINWRFELFSDFEGGAS